MQVGFYFDQNRCIGCYTCVVACKDWHDIEAGAASWCKVTTSEYGKFPDVHVSFSFSACYHCANPTCISVCTVGAISKRKKDGIVVVNGEECLGKDACGLCLEACPFEAPQFGNEQGAKMQKCDLCQDRLADSKKPVCVTACRTRALDFGDVDKLIEKYGNIRPVKEFNYSKDSRPSIIYRPKVF